MNYASLDRLREQVVAELDTKFYNDKDRAFAERCLARYIYLFKQEMNDTQTVFYQP
jgi:hypothetical protein